MECKLVDLLDIEAVQKLLDSFYNVTGILSGIMDIDGNILTKSGWQDICAKFHRVCISTAEKCQQSDSYINNYLLDKPYISYKCLNGLMDYAAPIFIENQHLGSIYTGQFLHEPPDEMFFRQQARKHGFNETAYIEALKKVPIIPIEKMDSIISYFLNMADILASMGLEHLRKIQAMQIDLQNRKRSEQEINAQREWLRVTLSSIGDAVIATDIEGKVLFINQIAQELTGYIHNEAHGRKIEEVFNIVSEETGLPADIPINRVLSERVVVGLANHTALISKDGTIYSIADSAAPIQNNSGEIIGVILVFHDITERKRAEYKLKKSEQKYRDIVENATEGIFQTTLQGRFISVNPACVRIFGSTSPEEMANNISDISQQIYANQEDRKKLLLILTELGRVENFEIEVRRSDGRKRWISINARVVCDPNGEILHLEGSCVDITERKLAEERLKYLSQNDILTGLFNRGYFEEEMKHLEDVDIPVGIIVCDIDGLKLINDTLGHKTGDELLVAASKAIKAVFNDEVIVARVGGDEFTVILPLIGIARLEEAAKRIHTEIDLYNLGNPEIPLSMSIGTAFKQQNEATSIYDLFKRADNKMYRKKLLNSKSARSALVNALVRTMEARDINTEEHSGRMLQLLASMIGEINSIELNLNDLLLFAQFHDIGKVGIPDHILFKPGPLTVEERVEMQRHSEIGHRIAQASPDLAPIADLILKHHEWWNGTGYPLGIKEDQIPLECRILAIVDAYDAMTSDRPYRKAMPHNQAVTEIIKYKNLQFDPNLVDMFLQTHSLLEF